MNKIFRVIWSAANGNWVVVSELVRTATTKSISVRKRTRQADKAVDGVVYGGTQWKLADISCALFLAGLMTISAPAWADINGSIDTGANNNVNGIVIAPSSQMSASQADVPDCKPTKTGAAASISIGCGATSYIAAAVSSRRSPHAVRTEDGIFASNGTTLVGGGAVAIGHNAEESGGGGVAIGGNSKAAGGISVAIGPWAYSSLASVSLGGNAIATGKSTLAIGRESVAKGNFSQALGNQASALGGAAFAVGTSTEATGLRSIAIGSSPDVVSVRWQGDTGANTRAYGDHAIALGASTHALSNNTIAMGNQAKASADSGIALGAGAQATRANSVALGDNSTTEAAATAINNATVGPLNYSGFAGIVNDPNRVVSVGAAGAERQLKNVGSGEISATSTDAINGSQLYAVAAKQGWKLQTNGDAATKVNTDDTVQFIDGTNIDITRAGLNVTIATSPNLTADSLTINKGGPVLNAAGADMKGKKITNLSPGTAPNDAVNFSQLEGVKSLIQNNSGGGGGINLQANGDTASKVNPTDTVQFLDGTNIDITRAGNNVTVATSPALTADSLSINKGGPVIDANGIDMNDKKVTDLAPGTIAADSKDAVNGSQLFDTNTNVANNAAEIEKGIKFGDGTTANQYALGDTLNVLGDSNVTSTTTAKGVQLGLAPVVTIGDAKPVVIDGKKGTVSGLSNVAFDPKATYTGGQAATQEQLQSAYNNVNEVANKGWNLQANGDTASKVAPGDTVQFLDGTNIDITRDGNNVTVATSPALTADSLSINKGGPVIDANGIDMNDKKVTDLAPGTIAANSKDAVNGSQLFDTNTNVANNAAEIEKGIKFGDGTTANQYALGDTLNVLGDSNVTSTATPSGVQLGLAPVVTIGDAKPVVIDGKKGTVSGLSNVAFDPKATYTGGQAATQEQLQSAYNNVNEVANKGWNLQANGDTASKVAPGDTVQFLDGTNISITRAGNDVTVATTPALTADSLTINNGGPVIDANGIDMNDKKVTDLAPGTIAADSKDAVNGSQLFDTNTNVANNAAEIEKGIKFGDGTTANQYALGDTLNVLGDSNVTSTVKPNGVQLGLAPVVTIGDTKPVVIDGKKGTVSGLSNVAFDPKANYTGGQAATQEQLQSAYNNVNEVANKGWNLQANGDTASKVAPGDTVQFLDGTNIDITRDGNNVTVATSPALTADSLSINKGGPVIDANGIDMNDKKVTDLAPGTIAADSKDAVNGSQLFALGDSTATSLGGDSAFDPVTGKVTAALKVGDKTFNNVNDALGEAGKGFNLQANGDTASKVAPGDTVQFLDGTNIDITRDGNNVTVATSPALTADSLTINNGGPVIDANGIDMNNKKVTDLAPGTIAADSKDAVNGSQLFDTNTNVANNAAEIEKGIKFGDGTTANKYALGDTINVLGDSNVTSTTTEKGIQLGLAPVVTVGETKPVVIDGNEGTVSGLSNVVFDPNANYTGGQAATQEQLQAAYNEVNEVANKGWNLQANGDTASKVALGDTVQFLDGTNISVTRAGNDVTVATTPALTADSLTINNGGPVMNADGIDMNDKKVTDLAPGTIAADSKDAVNGSQLFDTNTNVANNAAEIEKGINFGDGTTANKYALGDTINVLGDSNVTSTTTEKGVQLGLAPVVTVGETKPVVIDGNEGTVSGLSNVAFDPKTNYTGGQAATQEQLQAAYNEVNEVANKGWDLQLNNEAAENVGPGGKVKLADGTNIAIVKDGDAVKISTTPDLTADSLTINNGGPVINGDGIDMNDKKVTDLAPGTIAADSKDAVNGSQLFAVGGR